MISGMEQITIGNRPKRENSLATTCSKGRLCEEEPAVRPRSGRTLPVIGIALVIVSSTDARGQLLGDRNISAKAAVAPWVPALSPDLVASMQEGQYDEAIAALKALIADPKSSADDRAYYALIEG